MTSTLRVPCETMRRQESDKSTKGKEKAASENKTSVHRKGLERKEEKALRKRIRYFRLEHDRQVKSLTQDLKDMKEYLQAMSSDKEKGTSGQMDERKRTSRYSPGREKRSSRELIGDELGDRRCEIHVDEQNKRLLVRNIQKGKIRSSRASMTLIKEESDESQDVPVNFQQPVLTRRANTEKAVGTKDVVLSITADHRRTREGREIEKVDRFDLPGGLHHKSGMRNKTIRSPKTKDSSSCSGMSEKRVSDDPQRLYRTSKVTCIGLAASGLRGQGIKDGGSDSSSSLHYSANTCTRLPSLDMRRTKGTSKS